MRCAVEWPYSGMRSLDGRQCRNWLEEVQMLEFGAEFGLRNLLQVQNTLQLSYEEQLQAAPHIDSFGEDMWKVGGEVSGQN